MKLIAKMFYGFQVEKWHNSVESLTSLARILLFLISWDVTVVATDCKNKFTSSKIVKVHVLTGDTLVRKDSHS